MTEEKITKTVRYTLSNWNRIVDSGNGKKYVEFTNKLVENHFKKLKKNSDPIIEELEILKEDQKKADEEVREKLAILRQIDRKVQYLEGAIEEKKNKGVKKE